MRTLLRHAKEPSVEIGLREFIADAESRLEPINNCDAEESLRARGQAHLKLSCVSLTVTGLLLPKRTTSLRSKVANNAIFAI